MYETHFGLRLKPFAVTPNPRFLYPSRSHREALAALVYGVKHRRGFICLVGEVGTGKTTLLRALLDGLNVSVRTA
jgi:general secretion pathway protein A